MVCTFTIQIECHYPYFQDANSSKIKQWKGVSKKGGGRGYLNTSLPFSCICMVYIHYSSSMSLPVFSGRQLQQDQAVERRVGRRGRGHSGSQPVLTARSG